MKRFFLATVPALAGAMAMSAANAADLPTKAPSVAPYNWTGFYIGGNVGGAWQRLSNSLSIINNVGFNQTAIPGINASGSPELNASSVTFGGQLGFNQQIGNIVYGAEVDFNWFNLKNDAGGTFNFTTTDTPYVLTTSERTQWLFTARPKIGWAADRTLFYVTGGLAVTRIQFEQEYGEPRVGIPIRNVASATKTKLGWTAGLGGEWALQEAWSLKAEYLYAHFNTMDTVVRTTNPTSTFSNSLSTLQLHTVRLGLNYRFGGI